jgi:phage terminase large subunit
MGQPTTVVIPYVPRPWALRFHDCGKRWIVLVWHRRAGKTTSALNHLQRDALRVPKSRYAYIAPTYKQAKNVAWDLIKNYARPIPGVEFNEVELTVRYPNGSRLTLYGADNPDSLRGIGLWGVVFDEYSQQPSNIFTEIIRPALADHQGYAIWIGTPKGKNDFFTLYETARKDEDWFAYLLKASESQVIPQSELEDARKIMTEDEYLQEFECSFDAAIKGAYYAKELAKARSEGRITRVPYDPRLPVQTVWDLGIGDSTSIIFFQQAGKEVRFIDYYENSGEGLAHYAGVLQSRGYIYGIHWAPHDIEVRELGSGQSRLEIARKLGINFQIVPQLSVEDGINAARLRFSSLWIDEAKCERLLFCLSSYRKEWDDDKGMFKNKPLHDFASHAADAFRYFACTPDGTSVRVQVFKPKASGFAIHRKAA